MRALTGINLAHAVARSLRKGVKELNEATAWRDANELIALASGSTAPHSFAELSTEEHDRLETYVKRRCEQEPLAYITGSQPFWKSDFFVNPHVLIPRPCSEIVVETLLQRIHRLDRQVNVLDLCTGSGCLLLSVMMECSDASGVGVDVSLDALAVARQNAVRCGVQERSRFMVGDVLCSTSVQDAVREKQFDYIICNPPYINAHEMSTLPSSVKEFEPALALAAGDDGLQFYKALVERMRELLAAQLVSKQAVLVMEVGWNQARAVTDMFSLSNDPCTVDVVKDYRGVERVVEVCY